MPKVYTPKHGRIGKGKDSFPRLPHQIGFAGFEFAPKVYEHRGTAESTVNPNKGLPEGGKKGY